MTVNMILNALVIVVLLGYMSYAVIVKDWSQATFWALLVAWVRHELPPQQWRAK